MAPSPDQVPEPVAGPTSGLAGPPTVSSGRRLLMLGLGWTLVLLGLAGLVLPVLQGVLFLAIGFAILARHSSWAATRVEAVRRRFPAVDAAMKHAAGRTARLFRRELQPPRA